MHDGHAPSIGSTDLRALGTARGAAGAPSRLPRSLLLEAVQLELGEAARERAAAREAAELLVESYLSLGEGVVRQAKGLLQEVEAAEG